MKKIKVGVVDYGMGNLHSVAKALSLQGAQVLVSDRVASLRRSDVIVLPGVGSFGSAARILKKKKLDSFLKGWIKDEKPYIGICLGYQLLFERSEEDPKAKGLGVLKGRVVRFKKSAKQKMSIPHMGWNQAVWRKSNRSRWFAGIKSSDRFYFVHSYYPVPRDKALVATQTHYGKRFCSAVANRHLFASQFHPEKSGRIGLNLLKTILKEVHRITS